MFAKVSMIAKVVRSFSRDDTGANLPHIDLQSEVTLDQLTCVSDLVTFSNKRSPT